VSVRKTSYTLGLLLTFAVMVMLPVLHADEINQATKVTFNQAVQAPGRTLPAGTHWFERAGTNDAELIRVYNSYHEFIATLFTASRQRQQATEHTAFVFANQGAGKAPAIVALFYPGSTTGHEFLSARPERQKLAPHKEETVVAGD
jgi:hypothetical protein